MSSARDTPDAAVTIAADSHAPLPLAWHEQTEWENQVAYDQGYRRALEDVAAGTVELHTTWAPIGRRGYTDWVRERLDQMEDAAAKVPSATWRGRYPGGPVDWDTGRLVQRTNRRPDVREAA